jgi:integrase
MMGARRGRNEGCVYRRPDGLWVARISFIDSAGKRRRPAFYTKSKREALEKLDELKRKATGQISDTRRMTVGVWLDEWLTMSRSGLAPSTSQRYEQLVRMRLKPSIGGVKLSQVGVFHVQKLLGDLERQEISPRGIQMAYRVLYGAFRQAVKVKLIPSNVAADVEGNPRVPKPKVQTYSSEEVAKLLAAAAGHRLAPLLTLALSTGARQGELMGLRWKDIDFANGAVMIRHNLEELKGRHRLKEPKNGKTRRVDLASGTLNALAEHRKAMVVEGHCSATAPVFCDTNGNWLRKSNFIRQVFRKWEADAGVPRRRWHDLRHTCASMLLAEGTATKVVQERLGHHSAAFTLDQYAHTSQTMQREAAEVMDRILSKKTGS